VDKLRYKERQVGAAIKEWFHQRGFEPYVAIQAQSLTDINSGIIGELKRSDFHVFIDFRRERLIPSSGFVNPFRRYPHRGSLFTNQELAVAFLLEFDNAIFLRQEGIDTEGLLRYMGSNAERFETLRDVPVLIEKLVGERHWHTYEIFAENFPVLRFDVKLAVSENPQATSAMLVESEAV
jgi:hypothetical protein